MVEAILMMLGLGVVCGTILGIASKVFYVYEDPRIAEVEGCLAGANCGACGYAGCSAAAVAVVAGRAQPNVCIIGGQDSASSVAGVMGVDPGTAEPLRSLNTCQGGKRAEDRFYYSGVESCRALAAFYGGKRVCHIGCLGYGDCIQACKFDAIHMDPKGYPVVDEAKCVGCMACEKACPKEIINVKSMSQRLLELNCEEDALAPCRQTCPAEINIPQYIAQVRAGDYEGSVRTIRERNPLLLACGRVCPHPCESYCRRGLEDEPVSINQLKRFVADLEMNSGKRYPITCAPETGKRVAIIGGGPAGLSCAYFLKRVGHHASIYEAMPKLGGMLRYGIPEYRLPKKVLEWEIDSILNLGIDYHTNVKLGLDFDVGSLVSAGYDAVFLSVGAWNDYNLNIDGEDLEGCFTGIDFLSRIGLGEKIAIGRRVAVIGGGNTAIDCVRTLIRLGAREAYIVYRRTRREMPANAVEIDAAEHEGVKFHFLAAPVRVIGDDQGHVKQLEYLQMELGEPDASGRRRPVPIEGSETRLDVDMLITAIGQAPDVSFKSDVTRLKDLNITRRKAIAHDPITMQSTIPYIFTGGDAATGASLVIEAIGAGRRAARSIHQYMMGEKVAAPPKALYRRHIAETLFEHVEGVRRTPRAKMPELPVEERIHSFDEADLVLSEKSAVAESKRCLSCCRLCYDPDVSKVA